MTSQTQTRPRWSMSRLVGLVMAGSEAKRVARSSGWTSRLATALAGSWTSLGSAAPRWQAKVAATSGRENRKGRAIGVRPLVGGIVAERPGRAADRKG